MSAVAEQAAQVAAMAQSLAQQARELAQAVAVDGWKPGELADGESIGINDADGQPLHVGARVKVTGSDRYGETTAIVRGPGPDLDDYKTRVHVALENGENDLYTPSTGRVHLIEADAE